MNASEGESLLRAHVVLPSQEEIEKVGCRVRRCCLLPVVRRCCPLLVTGSAESAGAGDWQQILLKRKRELLEKLGGDGEAKV